MATVLPTTINRRTKDEALLHETALALGTGTSPRPLIEDYLRRLLKTLTIALLEVWLSSSFGATEHDRGWLGSAEDTRSTIGDQQAARVRR